jgi:hypothetical protein
MNEKLFFHKNNLLIAIIVFAVFLGNIAQGTSRTGVKKAHSNEKKVSTSTKKLSPKEEYQREREEEEYKIKLENYNAMLNYKKKQEYPEFLKGYQPTKINSKLKAKRLFVPIVNG